MRYQEKVLSIVFKVKSARFRRQDHGFRQSDHGFRSQDHRLRRTVKIGRFKSETMIELNRKVRSAYIGIDDRFGSEYAIICADLSLNNVTDSEAFPGLIRQTHRKIRAASADGAYDTRLCHDELRRKKISALIPPRKGAGYWPGEYADRNRAVANQRMTGSNARWKWTTDYNRRSIAETAMYRVKQLFGGSLTLRDYDGQVAEAMALVRALNKMTKAGMPESVRIA
ncbi:IS5 family transposase [Pluralibacter gergoviae]|uniref:IS5 family transposase n=1 Tax=Pluralibacter gergoviae TaxID=61647 RepID=UPI003EE14451